MAAYSVVRHWAVARVAQGHFGGPFPYEMAGPAGLLGQIQEAVGWSLALGLAWVWSERLVARAGLERTPFRTTAAAAVVLLAVCLAVEAAAVAGGWWTWSLTAPAPGSAWAVPRVALLDWSFVAIDALLPYLLWTSPSGRLVRAVASLAFAVHMLGHTWLRAWPEPLPVTGNDLAHVGLAAWVLWQACAASTTPPVPAVPERWSALPAWAAAIVALACATTHVVAGQVNDAWSVLPLLALAGLQRRAAAASPSVPGAWALRALVVGVALGLLFAVRAPEARRQGRVVALVQSAAAALERGAAAQAERDLRAALVLRPRQTGARTLLAVVLLRQGREVEARAQLESAVTAEPAALDALALLIELDLRSGGREVAARRVAAQRALFPARPELEYLQERVSGQPPTGTACAAAARRGPSALRSVRGLAALLGDEATLAACDARLAPR